MTNLLELIKQYPTLSIYAWVDGGICSDDYAYGLGRIGKSYRTKIICLERYYWDENRVFEYEDKYEVFEYYAEQEEYENLTDEEIWAMVENLNWEECILVQVGL